MKELALGGKRPLVTLVDDEDFDVLSQYSWNPMWSRPDRWYATRSVRLPGGKKIPLFMHRVIMNPSPEQRVDHIDGNGLDNRRSNLRICTGTQNNSNQKKRVLTLQRFKGVSLDKRRGTYCASIQVNYRKQNLGSFGSDAEAAVVYDEAARKLFGPFACVNFPLAGERSALTGEIAAANAMANGRVVSDEEHAAMDALNQCESDA